MATTKWCGFCDGRGIIVCKKCHGSGKVPKFLNSKEFRICPKCKGVGKEKCYTCNGTGLAWKNPDKN